MRITFGKKRAPRVLKKTKLSDRNTKIIAVVIGLISLITGASFTYYSYTFTQTAITTTGVVTDIAVSRSSRGSNGGTTETYTPTISFVDEQGAAQSAQVLPGQNSYNFPVGTEKRIRYNPDNPSHIKFDSWFELWGIGAIFLVVGFGIFTYLIVFPPHTEKHGVSPDESGASAEGLEQMTGLLRKMGRHAEADEILKTMQSADNDAQPRG